MIGVAAAALVATALLLSLRARTNAVLAELESARAQHLIAHRRSLQYAEHLKKNVLPYVCGTDDIEECNRELSACAQSARFHERGVALCTEHMQELRNSRFGIRTLELIISP
jgi:hypothetical protein